MPLPNQYVGTEIVLGPKTAPNVIEVFLDLVGAAPLQSPVLC